jgi:hypothetical protein
MKPIFLFSLLLYCVMGLSQAKPTPAYNLMTYKIAELYKRAGDESYIVNDLNQSSPAAGDYSLEQRMYKRSNSFLSIVDTHLLFADKDYENYCSSIGLDTSSAFGLFKEELEYRTYLTSIGAPYFVFDPMQTLRDFDDVLPDEIKSYYQQLLELDDRIEHEKDKNQRLGNLKNSVIDVSSAVAQNDIQVAEENRDYYERERDYHKSIIGRYNDLLDASVKKQKAIAASIQSDLKTMDDLGNMNTGLLASAVSGVAGLPDLNKINSFITNPTLKGTIDLTLSNAGSATIEKVAGSLNITKQMVEAYKDISSIYNNAQQYYQGSKEVIEFVKKPSLGAFSSALLTVGKASGRTDFVELSNAIESGKNVWDQLSGCTEQLSCDCIFKLMNSVEPLSNQARDYLQKLKQYNFSCATIDEAKEAIEHPSFDMIQSLVANHDNLFGAGASEDIAKLKELQKTFQNLNSKSGFDQFLNAGEQLAKTLAPTVYENWKTEVLGKKQLFLLYELLLAKDKNSASIIINQLKVNSSGSEKVFSFLEGVLKERDITPNNVLRSLLKVYPEEFCNSFPASISIQLGSLLKPKANSCNEILTRYTDKAIFLDKITFLDTAIVFDGQKIQYNLNEILSSSINHILVKTSLSVDIQRVIKGLFSYNLPMLKGKVNLLTQEKFDLGTQSNLFDKTLASLPGNSQKAVTKQISNTNLGMYAFGKVKDQPTFTKSMNADLSINSITKYEQPDLPAQNSGSSTSDAIKNMVAQAAISYFAPGALQAAQIISNLFQQGQLADAIHSKNEELREEVKNYIDKSLEQDKYRSNVNRAEHERVINDLIAKGKRNNLNILAKSGREINFQRQIIDEQIQNNGSYYYYLLERLRESFTKYLWAYRKWFGNTYQYDQLKDPNAIRQILDPQIRFLTFFNYSNLGHRKNNDIMAQWKPIIPTLLLQHKHYNILEKRDSRSQIIVPLKNVIPDQWDKFYKWFVDDSKVSDTEYVLKLNIDLLNPNSTSQWTIGFGADLQDRLLHNNTGVNLPFGFRLLGINVEYVSSAGDPVLPTQMLSRFSLATDPTNPPKINYGDQFNVESLNIKPIDFRFQTDMFDYSENSKTISYHKQFWGLPLFSNFIVRIKKSNDPIANQLRKDIKTINLQGLYFLNISPNLERTQSPQFPIPFKVGNTTYQINFNISDHLNFNTDNNNVKAILSSLEKKLNK